MGFWEGFNQVRSNHQHRHHLADEVVFQSVASGHVHVTIQVLSLGKPTCNTAYFFGFHSPPKTIAIIPDRVVIYRLTNCVWVGLDCPKQYCTTHVTRTLFAPNTSLNIIHSAYNTNQEMHS